MQNKPLSTLFFTFLFTASMLLHFPSKASAEDFVLDYKSSIFIDGAHRCYDVPLYATEIMANGDDFSTYEVPIIGSFSEIYITINTSPTIPGQFTPPVINNSHGCDWSFDAVPWHLNLLDGSDLVAYRGYNQDIMNFNTQYPLETFCIKYQTVKAGLVTMRVTSPGTKKDGSDSTAYTILINVVDNTPKSSPSPTPKSK